MRTISIRLDDHSDALLMAFCERHGMSQTDAVKTAIAQLEQSVRARPAELARALGLVGSFRSSEGDLGERHSDRIKQRLRQKAAR